MLIGKLENIKQPFSIDIATGDPITPSAVEYEYQLMIENRKIPIKAYNLETVIAVNYRETEWNIIQISALLELIKQNTIMKTRWKQYAKSHPFAKQLSHHEVIEGIAEVVSIMETVLNYTNKSN